MHTGKRAFPSDVPTVASATSLPVKHLLNDFYGMMVEGNLVPSHYFEYLDRTPDLK